MYRVVGWLVFAHCAVFALTHLAAGLGGPNCQQYLIAPRGKSYHLSQVFWYGVYSWFIGASLGWW